MKKLLSFFAVSLAAVVSPSSARKLTVTNNCAFTVWPGMFSSVTGASSSKPSQATGWEAPPGSQVSFDVPNDWTGGSIWGRTDCDFSKNSSCSTGSCSGGLECTAMGSPPVTVAELSLGTSGLNIDAYDVSLVMGYNLPMALTNTAGCIIADCINNVNAQCPNDLRVNASDGSVVGCKSCPISGGNDPGDSTTGTCSSDASSVLFYFKDTCPNAFIGPSDSTATRTCGTDKNPDYTVTFCAGFSVEQTLQSSSAQQSSLTSASDSSSTTSSSATTSPATTSSDQGLGSGAIGGIAGGTVAAVFILLGCSLCILSKRRQRRRYRENDALAPDPFIHSPGPQTDFDPYSPSNSNRNGFIPSSMQKSSSGQSPQSPSTEHPANDQPEAMNQLRLGNLKLQQRVAILLGRDPPSGASQAPLPPQENAQMTEQRPSQPVIHTDSGWRQRELVNEEDVQDVPPTYTEI
ncbi:hypothetical protein D9758_010168 [Tetrapyrgos nigripes]|uniref:Thaumatin-like protein n=1 Tax=Tetrapyrgos nigripes TaxID=182062 RepID=A0A8H5CXN3_9AGAR|nr:hypothetical protein D9758_010168 [Tetrapyrgos nigripes]